MVDDGWLVDGWYVQIGGKVSLILLLEETFEGTPSPQGMKPINHKQVVRVGWRNVEYRCCLLIQTSLNVCFNDTTTLQ